MRAEDHAAAIGLHKIAPFPDAVEITSNCICCYNKNEYTCNESIGSSCHVYVFSSPSTLNSTVPFAMHVADCYDNRKASHPQSFETSKHLVKHIITQLNDVIISNEWIVVLRDTEYNVIHIVFSPTLNMYHALTTTTAQAVATSPNDMPRDTIYVLRNEPSAYFLTWYESGISQTTPSRISSRPRECHLCRV